MISAFNALWKVVFELPVTVATLFMMVHWRVVFTILAGLWIVEMHFALAAPRRPLNAFLLVILVLEIAAPVAFVIGALTIKTGSEPLEGLGPVMLLVAGEGSLSVLAIGVVVPVARTHAKEFRQREGISLAHYVAAELGRELRW